MVFATCLIREGIDMAEKILNIEDLSIWYRTYRGYSQVVDHIHLHVDKGEKIGLVGESGCGKTTTMKTVMGVLGKDLIHIPNGTIDFRGKNVLTISCPAVCARESALPPL